MGICAPLCPNLLADIFGDLPDGTSYHRIMNNPVNKTHANCIHDGTKLTLLYSQIHFIANTHQLEQIVFDFFDDREDILSDISDFFSKYTDMLPNRVCLRLNRYKENELSLYKKINGTCDHVDTSYRQTIINMIEITPRNENHPDRRCTDNVTPEKLNGHHVSTPNEHLNNWRTTKTHALQSKIQIRQNADMNKPHFAPEVHLLHTLAHFKKYIPQNDIKYDYITHAMLNRLHSFYKTKQPISIDILNIALEISRIERANDMKEIYITPSLMHEIQTQQPTINGQLLYLICSYQLLSMSTSNEIFKRGDIYETRVLIEHNRQILEQIDEQGMTPLDIAISQKNDRLAIYLIEVGARITANHNEKTHALHIAAKCGRLNPVKILLEQNPELINTRDKDNKTPLLWAASKGHGDIVEWLITQGADVNIASQSEDPFTNTNNYTPLDWAKLYIAQGFDGEQTLVALNNAGAISNYSSFSILSDHKLLLDAEGEYETDTELFGEDDFFQNIITAALEKREQNPPTLSPNARSLQTSRFFHSTDSSVVNKTLNQNINVYHQKL